MKKLNLEALDRYNGTPLDTPVQFDLSNNAKAKIKQNVKDAGVNMSIYMRAVALSDDIIYVLDKKGSIAQSIIEANDILNYSLSEKKISEVNCNKLIYKLNDALKKLESIYEELSDVSTKDTSRTETSKENCSAQPKKAHIQFMVSKELKEYIDNKANGFKMSTSQFLRVSALAENKVTVLGKGNYVTRYIIEFQNNLNIAFKEDKIDMKLGKIIRSKSSDIYNKFIDVSMMLTNITELEGSRDEEEDE